MKDPSIHKKHPSLCQYDDVTGRRHHAHDAKKLQGRKNFQRPRPREPPNLRHAMPSLNMNISWWSH